MFDRLALIGCGLMGGSFALACKRARLVRTVAGTSATARSAEVALHMGAIDRAAHSAREAVQGADLVLVAVPVAAAASVFAELEHAVAPNALILDVGSTKQDVVAAAQQLGARGSRFVPCHPITGSETAGVRHAQADLYRGHTVVLTPTAVTAPEAADQAEALWRDLETRVVRMTPAAHDAALAAVSHLPHLLAFAYMQGLDAESVARHDLALAGPGFRDFTRIAASSPGVWRDIFLANRAELQKQLAHFQQALAAAQALLDSGDGAALHAWIAHASDLRAHWHPGVPSSAAPDVHHALS